MIRVFTSTLCLVAGLAQAATIHGTVSQEFDGTPIDDVAVVLRSVTGVTQTTRTDLRGEYRFDDVRPARYRIRVLPDGRQPIIGAWNGGMYEYCDAALLDLRTHENIEVHFPLPSGGMVTGRLVDSETGQPIAGALVYARGLEMVNRSIQYAAQTDGDGMFELMGLDSWADAPALYLVEASVPGRPRTFWPGTLERDAAEGVAVRRDSQVDLGDMVIPVGSGVVGSVVDSLGQGIQGMQIFAEGLEDFRTTTSDVDGSFSISGLAPGPVWLLATSPDWARTWYPDSATRVAATPVDVPQSGNASVSLSIAPAGVVRIRYVDQNGFGAGSIDVAVVIDGSETAGWARTDNSGWAEIRGLPGGNWTVVSFANAGGYLPIPDITLGSVEAGAALEASAVVERGTTLYGGVFNRVGAPIVGASVNFSCGEENYTSISSSEGTFLTDPIGGPECIFHASYQPLCPDDPGVVPMYFPGVPAAQRSQTIEIIDDALQFVGAIELPQDDDRDEMDDIWEWLHGLDPRADDAALDPDGDGVDNLVEYQQGTDPTLGSVGCTHGLKPPQPLHAIFVLLLLHPFRDWRSARRSQHG